MMHAGPGQNWFRPLRSLRLVAAGLLGCAAYLTVSSASGADLEAGCCADLEERIAELEATTARKGNRKIDLSISGQVSQAVIYWNDGAEQDVYQVQNSNSSDRIRLDGSAKITNDLSAGFLLSYGLRLPSSASIDQFNSDVADLSPRLRDTLWYLRSRKLGAVSVGRGEPATDDIINYTLGETWLAGYADTRAVGTNLFLRDGATQSLNSLASGNTTPLRWRQFLPGLDTPRENMVRYDSPVVLGSTVSLSWGGDDFWDIAFRHTNKVGPFKYLFGVGYFEDREEQGSVFGWPQGGSSGGETVIRDLKGSASIMHMPTGLFASGAYVHRTYSGNDLGVFNFACFPSTDATSLRAAGVACDHRPDFDYFWVSSGVKRTFFDFGSTSFYGEYARSFDAITGLNVSVNSATGGDLDFVTKSEMEIWGLGVVQSFNAAAMDVFLSYRHFSANVEGLEASGQRYVAPLEDADIIFAGSRIRF